MQRANSPISDPEPYLPPEPIAPQQASDDQFASLGMSKRWPEVKAYLQERKEFYQKYLPDGTPILSATPEQRVAKWDTAVAVIGEIDAIIAKVEMSADAVRQSTRG